MLKNYLKIAVRNLKRNLGYTTINVGGLSIGIACVLLLVTFVRDEVSYDRFHDQAAQIYRVHVGQEQEVTPTIAAPLLKRSLAEIAATTRLYDIGRFQAPVVRKDQIQFHEKGFFFADSTVFDVFTLPLQVGNAETALVRPHTLVMSASAAQKYFPNENPLGKVVQVGSRGRSYEITGVMEDLPAQSHIQFDFLASFVSTNWATREIWDSANFYTYVRLHPGASLPQVEAKVAGLVDTARSEELVDDEYAWQLISLLDIRPVFEGRRVYIWLLSTIALLILLIACINYINLATARGAKRAREVGVRKVSGAQRLQLVQQFLGESFLTTILALIIAVLIAELVMPFFNAITAKQLAIYYTSDAGFWLYVLGILLLVSCAGGAYPALLLSSYKPLDIFKSQSRHGTGSSRLRRTLVVFQFAVSVILIVGTAVIYRQLNFMQTKDLGFEKERLVVMPLGLGNAVLQTYPSLRAALLQESAVEEVAAVNHIPGYQQGGYGFQAEGVFDETTTIPPIGGVPSDANVVQALGLELLAGQPFMAVHHDSVQSGRYQYLLNEAAVNAAGWGVEEAVGKRVALSGNREGFVTGVIADYHFLSLHEQIQPMAYFYEPSGCNYMLVKLGPGQIGNALASIESVWATWLPDRPFSYTFLDDELEALYQTEQQTSSVFLMSSVLAIVIACLGLFGLAAFTASQRKKEVGIRKAMGASVMQMVLLLTKEFSLLVMIGFGLAVPVAFWIMQMWLQNFAYKTPLSVGLFLSAGLVVLLIAWLTVSYQAIRAAQTNPIEALRYE